MGDAREKKNERRRLVLTVKDETFITMELEAALTSGRFQVLGAAATVANAVHLLREQSAELGVLDLNLGRKKWQSLNIWSRWGFHFLLASAADATELTEYTVFTDRQFLQADRPETSGRRRASLPGVMLILKG